MNSAKWIDLATLNQVTEIMDKAVETATKTYGPDSAELRRLRKSKMGVDHVWLSRYYPLRRESREKKLPFLGPERPGHGGGGVRRALRNVSRRARR